MAGISIGGLATGIDSKTLISQLMSLERNPQKILQSKATAMQGKIDVFNRIGSSLDSLKSLMDGMDTVASLTAMTATSSDTAVVTASASSTAVAGTHSLTVSSLASSQILVSDSATQTGYADAAAKSFGTGTITISDTTAGGTPVTVTVTAENNSLNGIAAAINASGANLTASVINDGGTTPYRLSIIGKDTHTYSLTAALTGGTYDNPTFTQKVAASNAVFTLDGISMTRTANSVTDAIPGVTLSLLKQSATAVKVTVANNTAGVAERINSFVSAYNSSMAMIYNQSTYVATSSSKAALLGDSTVRTAQNRLQAIVSTRVTGATAGCSTLADIGITTDRKSGNLVVDQGKLTTALTSRFTDVVALFTRNSGVSGLTQHEYGISEQFKQVIDDLTHAYVPGNYQDNGLISTRVNGLRKSITDINDRVEAMEVNMVRREEALKRQYASLESLVSSLSTQGNALIAALSKLS
jgi:flagellar hook-associated protein 2